MAKPLDDTTNKAQHEGYKTSHTQEEQARDGLPLGAKGKHHHRHVKSTQEKPSHLDSVVQEAKSYIEEDYQKQLSLPEDAKKENIKSKTDPEEEVDFRGYCKFSKEELDYIASSISLGGKAKEEFRKKFEVNTLKFLDYRAKRMLRGKFDPGIKNSLSWIDDTCRIASFITETIIILIEKGKYDFCFDPKPEAIDEDCKTKIENFAGILWKKMDFLFRTFKDGNIREYINDFSDDIPHDKKYLDFLLEMEEKINDPFLNKKIEAKKKNLKKQLRDLSSAREFLFWIRENAESTQLSSLDERLLADAGQNMKKIILDCFKSLPKSYIIPTMANVIGWLQQDIAEIISKTPSWVSQCISKSSDFMSKCIQEKLADSQISD